MESLLPSSMITSLDRPSPLCFSTTGYQSSMTCRMLASSLYAGITINNLSILPPFHFAVSITQLPANYNPGKLFRIEVSAIPSFSGSALHRFLSAICSISSNPETHSEPPHRTCLSDSSLFCGIIHGPPRCRSLPAESASKGS